MKKIVLAPDFLEGNFLSTDRRVPVTLLETNACSPLATNALENNIWDNFSSQSYKDLPSVGTIQVHNPITGEVWDYEMPGGGRGYTRPASLISLWSTAPFLLNNSVGEFNPDPSVAGRMASFNKSIEQMLWPERRKRDIDVVRELGLPESRAVDVPGYIYRTTATSCLTVPAEHVPRVLYGTVRWIAPWAVGDEGIELGPIPAGTPVNLLANLQLLPNEEPSFFESWEHRGRLLRLLKKIKAALKEIGGGCTPEAFEDMDRQEHALEVYRRGDIAAELVKLSKCPDFVVNKGHYFGTSFFKQEPGLSDADKRALIEFLKTF
jgi:hypothetical protein